MDGFAGGAEPFRPPAAGDSLSRSRTAARAFSQARSRPIDRPSHAGSRLIVAGVPGSPSPASSAGSSPEPLASPLALVWPAGWPNPVDPTVANAPPPDSLSKLPGSTETVSKVAARSSVVPERLKSCDTCCTEPLVACDSTPSSDEPPVGVTATGDEPASEARRRRRG